MYVNYILVIPVQSLFKLRKYIFINSSLFYSYIFIVLTCSNLKMKKKEKHEKKICRYKLYLY